LGDRLQRLQTSGGDISEMITNLVAKRLNEPRCHLVQR